MACRHEHNDHGGGCPHDHGNRPEDERAAAKDSLWNYIDIPKVRALNEHEPEACKRVLKPWHERLDTSKHLSSDADEELLIFIPFTEVVKLRAIVVIGGDEGEAPSKMRVFTNREDIDFDLANNSVPVQEWELSEDSRHGELEYATKYSKFTSVCNVTLHFPSNFGGDITTLYFLGLKGETTSVTTKQVIMNAVYESAPRPQDHKIADSTMMDVAPGM
mmetsp:Transcript_63876/g.114046  ORF Transcript_63876/g.114046 Transcript_63876/m.114046 type:complete len:218 (-) Transcript_63876:55-708(-)